MSGAKGVVLKLAAVLVGLVVVAGAGVSGVALTRWDRTFEAPYPAIEASDDEAVIEYGRYLVYGPMHCAYCHTPKSQHKALDAGETLPLIGGYTVSIPPGRFHMPNLTPDPETGIGRRTDAELARVLRHGVRADGRVAMPFMEFQQMSDADLRAVISYLRSQPAVRHEVPDHELTLLGKTVLATVLKPKGPSSPPPAESPPVAPTVERGRYLAHVAGQCFSCHTDRNLMDGSFTGPPFAGGHPFPSTDDPSIVYVSPNLTPDPETGVLARWGEDDFVARFRAGPVLPGSSMPWGAFARIAEDDLRALFRYLNSLDPVHHDVDPVVREAR
jgi:mono/diheme cytochrome c family protein